MLEKSQISGQTYKINNWTFVLCSLKENNIVNIVVLTGLSGRFMESHWKFQVSIIKLNQFLSSDEKAMNEKSQCSIEKQTLNNDPAWFQGFLFTWHFTIFDEEINIAKPTCDTSTGLVKEAKKTVTLTNSCRTLGHP